MTGLQPLAGGIFPGGFFAPAIVSHDPPASFGTIEPVRFTFETSPLVKRPISVSEMTQFIVTHLQYVFAKSYRMLNSDRLGHLATDQGGEITVVNGLLPDLKPDVLPKVTVTGKWYDTQQSPTTMSDGGIGVKIGNSYRGQGSLRLLKAVCTIQVKAQTDAIKRYLADEVQGIFLRDAHWIEKELYIKSLTIRRPFEQSEMDGTGRSVSGSMDFSHQMILTWVASLRTSDWTERSF